MGSFTQVLERALLDLVWGAQSYTPALKLYVGLSTTTIGNTGTGITEPAGADGYARVEIDNDSTKWPAASSGGPSIKANASEIAFPAATDDWGTVTDFFFSTSSSSTAPADIIAFAELDNPRTIEDSDTASFAIGAITISLD